jgi:hypothetical protein
MAGLHGQVQLLQGRMQRQPRQHVHAVDRLKSDACCYIGVVTEVPQWGNVQTAICLLHLTHSMRRRQQHPTVSLCHLAALVYCHQTALLLLCRLWHQKQIDAGNHQRNHTSKPQLQGTDRRQRESSSSSITSTQQSKGRQVIAGQVLTHTAAGLLATAMLQLCMHAQYSVAA